MEIVNKKTGDTHFHNVVRAGFQATRNYCETSPLFTKDILEVSNNLKQRPLHLAVASLDQLLTGFLLKKGAEVDAFKKGDWTSLMVACTFNKTESIEIIKLLLNHGANPKLKNKDGWTSMHLACKAGNAKAVEILATAEPSLIWEPSRSGRVSLHIAALNSQVEVVSLLVKAGGSDLCNRKDSCGVTPLLDAVISGCLETLELIMCHVDVTKHYDLCGLNSLHKAAQMGHTHVIKYLVEASSSNVNEQTNSEGYSPLHYAVTEQHVETITELLRLKADVNLCNKYGENALNMKRGLPPAEIQKLMEQNMKELAAV